MDDPTPTTPLSDLAHACASATESDPLLTLVLPHLLELADAQTAVVLRRRADEVTIAFQAGDDLPMADPSEVFHEAGEELSDVPVPDGWTAPGVARAAARRLPGHLGVLVLGWAPQATPGPWLDVAVVMIDGALSRLDAEERFWDLVNRVDNAQQLANMGDYDWHIASDTNRWSDQLYRIYGHEPQAFNASYERFISHIHPDDRDRIMGIHQEAYATGNPYQMIERIVRPDGQIRYLSSNGQVVMDGEGKPVRMRGTCIDITDRILAEQARERSANRFRNLVESSPDAILVIDAHGAILQSNGRAGDLLGGDPVGRTISEVLPEHGAAPGRGLEAVSLDGRPLRLDVVVAELSRETEEGLVAAFLHDASTRLASEAMAASLREVQVRRKQAIEINDNVVQGLTAAVYALEHGNADASASYLQRTLASARRMMNDLLDPLNGEDLEAGDLVRAAPSSLGDVGAELLSPPAPPAPNGRRRVLIADDSDDVRMLIRMKLELGSTCEVAGEAADGEEAVALAGELRPDLVLLDLAMPRMDGLQALPLIRDAAPDARVVVLSGFDENTLADKALAAGAVRYVEKGVALDDLAAVIDEALGVPTH